jgi:hypothetical protein
MCYVLTDSGAALIHCGTWLCSLVRNFCYAILYMVTCPPVKGHMTQCYTQVQLTSVPEESISPGSLVCGLLLSLPVTYN